jgi:hypothetical protein
VDPQHSVVPLLAPPRLAFGQHRTATVEAISCSIAADPSLVKMAARVVLHEVRLPRVTDAIPESFSFGVACATRFHGKESISRGGHGLLGNPRFLRIFSGCAKAALLYSPVLSRLVHGFAAHPAPVARLASAFGLKRPPCRFRSLVRFFGESTQKISPSQKSVHPV